MKQKDSAIEKIVALTIKLFETLKSMGIHDHNTAWLDFLHWDQKIDKKQKQARLLMDKITSAILQETQQVSSRLIHTRVIYHLLASAICELQ